jgi:hypothetical protein
MSTGPTASLRVEKQAAGANVNTWGEAHLNDAFDRFDTAIAGWLTKALTGNYTLFSANYVSDEARNASLKFTGTGAFAVTIPSVSKTYQVWNACTGILTITTGGSTNALIVPGEIVTVICDGANVYKEKLTDFGGSVLSSIGSPLATTDAATKAYVDAQAWAAMVGTLPGQVANTFLYTDGTTPSWQLPTVAQISDYASDQATKAATIQAADKAFAVCWALNF